MMNFWKYIFCIASVVLLTLSCAQDEGNYVYRELDEPVITGLADAQVLTFERLRIEPDLGDVAEGDYVYEWKAVDNNGTNEVTVIGADRILDCEVTLAPGSYVLYFTATDPQTGMYWQESMNLTVSSSMSEGWMVLCSDQGRARLDIVSLVTGETYRDVLKDNGMPEYNGPRRIQWLSEKTDEASPFYLLTDDGATRLGKDDFSWKPEYDFQYEVASPDKLTPYSIVSSGFGKVVVSGTKAYYCEIMGFDGLYGSAVNKDFAVAPYIGLEARNTITNDPIIVHSDRSIDPARRYAQAYKERYAGRSAHYIARLSIFRSIPNTNQKVVMLGNSITNNCWWNELLERDAAEVINRGISGDTVLGILDRLDDIVDENPAKIYLLSGVNDMFEDSNVAKEEVWNRYQQLIEAICDRMPDALALDMGNQMYTALMDTEAEKDEFIAYVQTLA